MSDDEIADSYGAYITDRPRATSPVLMTPEDEKARKEKDSDDEITVYGASAPQSRYSTRNRKSGSGSESAGDTAAATQSFISKTFGRRSTVRSLASSLYYERLLSCTSRLLQFVHSGKKATPLGPLNKVHVLMSRSLPCISSSDLTVHILDSFAC